MNFPLIDGPFQEVSSSFKFLIMESQMNKGYDDKHIAQCFNLTGLCSVQALVLE